MGSVNKAFTIPFFIVHYGLFWAVHGIFVFLLFSEGSLFSSGLSFRTGFDPFAMPEIALRLVTTSGALAVAALSLVLSHGVSFAANFVGRGEYRRLGLQQLMSQPYGRVMILHVTLIFGGFAIMVLGEPLLVLVLMIGIKIAVDASAHVRMASGFQSAIVDVLVAKTAAAAREFGANSVVVAGGVAANRLLRDTMRAAVDAPLFLPEIRLCTDNAAMVAMAGAFMLQRGEIASPDLDVDPNLSLTQ